MTSIISDAEAKQILKNKLRKQALDKRAMELNTATAQRKAAIMDQIDREIEQELQKTAWLVSMASIVR